MIKIIDNRGTGKTSRLLLLAKENDGVIVCSNPEAMREKSYRYGIVGIDFITYEHYLYNYDVDDARPIYIDEIDQLLKCFDACISGYTLSKE